MTRPTSNLVHGFFSLSYSNYLVLHRTLLQSMPDEWQVRFVDCINELTHAYRHIEHAPGYDVKPARSKLVCDLSLEELDQLKITVEDNAFDRVMVPAGEDPIPHYNRGRTYIEPAP